MRDQILLRLVLLKTSTKTNSQQCREIKDFPEENLFLKNKICNFKSKTKLNNKKKQNTMNTTNVVTVLYIINEITHQMEKFMQ